MLGSGIRVHTLIISVTSSILNTRSVNLVPPLILSFLPKSKSSNFDVLCINLQVTTFAHVHGHGDSCKLKSVADSNSKLRIILLSILLHVFKV